MSWLIYKHTLTADCPHYGWGYVGLTKKEPEQRWKSKGSGYTSSRTKTGQLVVFAKAIEKYGWESFSHEILESDIETFEDAGIREQYWIDFYHTYIYDPNCRGYNMTKGGGGSIGFKHTDETKVLIKQRLREVFPNGRFGEKASFYGKRHSAETLQKLSDYGKANPINYWEGKARSDETKEKLRQANLGKKLTEEQKIVSCQKRAATKIKNGTDKNSWVKIQQLDLEGNFVKEWPKLTDASDYYQIPPGNITKVCQGIRKSAGGFRWQYANK